MEDDFFKHEVEAAVDCLRNGGIILYPTDTIWGIGCDATNKEAVRKIYTIKKRADSKSLIALVCDKRDVLKYVASPDLSVFEFIEEQLRPTTVVYANALGLADNLVAADGSVAIRIVKDEFCKHLIKRIQKPIVSTSANISGEPSPQNFNEISNIMKEAVDHIVKWRQHDGAPALPSQIISWKNGKPVFIRS